MRGRLILGMAVAIVFSAGAYGAFGEKSTSAELLFRRAVWKSVPREARVKLFTHLPGFFPLPFVCSFFSASGIRNTLLPGDEAQALEGDAVLWCPNHSQAILKKGTSLRLEQEGGLPAYFVKTGALQIILSRTKLRLETPAFTLHAVGEAEKNQILALATADGSGLGCAEGLVDGKIGSLGTFEPKKKFILAHNCRFTLREFGVAEKVSLFSGDVTFESDLYVSRSYRPRQDYLGQLASFNIEIQRLSLPAVLSIAPTASPTGHLALSWSLPSSSDDLSCQLFTQGAENQELKAGYQFKPAGTKGLITLQKEFGSLWLSMICRGASLTVVSNALAPSKN